MKSLTKLLLWSTLSLCLNAQITLGPTVGTFGVLAGSTVTNSGPTVVTGNLGVSPGTAITGFTGIAPGGPGMVSGTIHSADAVALQAQNELTAAYNAAAGAASTATKAGDLGGQTLFAGVYTSSSSLGITGTVTLDAQGNPNAQFIFQIASGLTTATSSNVFLINGAQASNVFWQVGSSATLGTTSSFSGNILALSSISLGTGAVLQGRALARTGAVTLLSNIGTAPGGTGGDRAAFAHTRSVIADLGYDGTGLCRDLPGPRPATQTMSRLHATALTALALVACYISTLQGMFRQWSTDEDSSHGFAVPIVILWIVWRERGRWQSLDTQPSAWGFALLAAAAGIQVISVLGVGLFAGSVAFLVSVAGAILCLGGFAWLRAWLFPSRWESSCCPNWRSSITR